MEFLDYLFTAIGVIVTFFIFWIVFMSLSRQNSDSEIKNSALLSAFLVSLFFVGYVFVCKAPTTKINRVNSTVVELTHSKYWNEVTRKKIHSYYSDGVISNFEEWKIDAIEKDFEKRASKEQAKIDKANTKANNLAMAEKLK